MQNPNPNVIQNTGQNVGNVSNVSIPVSANMISGQIPSNLNVNRPGSVNPNIPLGVNQIRQFSIPTQVSVVLNTIVQSLFLISHFFRQQIVK